MKIEGRGQMTQDEPNVFSAHHSKTMSGCKTLMLIILTKSELINCMPDVVFVGKHSFV